MLIKFLPEDVNTAVQQGSIVVMTGTSEETGERVTIGGDSRAMVNIVDALMNDVEDEILVDVEGWQILRTDRP